MISIAKGDRVMSKDFNVRWGWLKGMYIYTIVVAGTSGLGYIVMPGTMQSILGMPIQDPMVFGLTGSVFLSFALLSILGLRSPLKFTPILLLQLSYKVLWLIGVILPALITGKLQTYALMQCALFATFVIGYLIAIPFSYVFAKETRAQKP